MNITVSEIYSTKNISVVRHGCIKTDLIQRENTIKQNPSHHCTENNTSCCSYCGKFLKSINIHISKAHPKEHRDRIVCQLPPIISTDSLHNQQISNTSNSEGIEITTDQTSIQANKIDGCPCFREI